MTFEAGDDIVFRDGRILTDGFGLSRGLHTVNLTADTEGGLDSDRGSISNKPGTRSSVVASTLNAAAFDGIGFREDFRVEVDALTALNSGENDIQISERDDIELVEVKNSNGAIKVFALGGIKATDVVSAESDLNADNNDDIELTFASGRC